MVCRSQFVGLHQLTRAEEPLAGALRFVVNVQSTMVELLGREDLTGDSQITIDDLGPKVSLFLWIFCPITDIQCAGDNARISEIQWYPLL